MWPFEFSYWWDLKICFPHLIIVYSKWYFRPLILHLNTQKTEAIVWAALNIWDLVCGITSQLSSFLWIILFSQLMMLCQGLAIFFCEGFRNLAEIRALSFARTTWVLSCEPHDCCQGSSSGEWEALSSINTKSHSLLFDQCVAIGQAG